MLVYFNVTLPCKLCSLGMLHTNTGLDNNAIAFFSLMSSGLPFIEVLAGFEYTAGEMNVMPTVERNCLGVGALSWSGRALHMALTWLSH